MKRSIFSSVSAALAVAGAVVLTGQVQAAGTEGATTVAPATVAPATVAPATVAPATVAPATVAPDTVTTATITPAVTAPQPAAGEASVATPVLIAFEAGEYKCELGRSVNVMVITPDRRSVSLNWGRKNYTMLAVTTSSGALRFEDNASGLVWIVIPAKAMLLDTSKGKQLANECRL